MFKVMDTPIGKITPVTVMSFRIKKRKRIRQQMFLWGTIGSAAMAIILGYAFALWPVAGIGIAWMWIVFLANAITDIKR